MPSLTDLVAFRKKKSPTSLNDSTVSLIGPATSGAVTSRKSTAHANRQSLPAAAAISVRHYDQLLAELRCPGCTRPLQAPIRLCATGHSVCATCTRRLAACPVCAAPVGSEGPRSLALEALAARAAFGCTNAAQGCTMRAQPAVLRAHEQRCVYQMGDCFMGRVWGGCEWQGRELDWLEHCQAEHSDRMFEGAEQELRWQCTSYEQRPKPLAAYYMFRAYGETFNLYQVLDPLRRRIAWTMICASKDPQVGQRFAFELELYMPSDERRLHVQRHGCHGERDDDVLHEGSCAAFELADVMRFVDAYRILHYRVRILAITPPGGQPSPSTRRAADIAIRATTSIAGITPPASPTVPARLARSNSTTSSIAPVDVDNDDDDDDDLTTARTMRSAAASLVSSSSFEHVAAVDDTAAAKVTPFQREFNSPQLVSQVAAAANQVAKPPRHSLERGVRAPPANGGDSDDVDGGGGCGEDVAARNGVVEAAEVEVVPLPPTTPLPRNDKSIEYAKTIVN